MYKTVTVLALLAGQLDYLHTFVQLSRISMTGVTGITVLP